jgi:hypothetical protein
MKRRLFALMLLFSLTFAAFPFPVITGSVQAQTAKTRVIDTIVDTSGNPRSGKVTFILTRKASSPGGIIPVGATVSAQLDAAGKLDISVYPSVSLSPKTYYQVWFVDNNNRQELIGVYDIPSSSGIVSLAAYKVTDTNLAAQYTFASVTDVNALVTTVSNATLSRLNGVVRADGKVQIYKSASGTFEDSSITDNGTAVTIGRNTTISGNQTVTGTSTVTGSQSVGTNQTVTGSVTAGSFVGNGAGITGLAGATGGISNTGSTTIRADSDNDGVGIIDLQGKNGVTGLRLNNDSTVDFLQGLGAPTVTSLFGGIVDVKRDYKAIGDGNSNPLSGRYGSLAAAQAAFPLSHAKGYITALTQQIDYATIQEAILAAAGRPVWMPEGTYVVSTTISYATTGNQSGLLLYGAGLLKTKFDNRVASGTLLSLDGSGVASTFQQGSLLSDFQIFTTTAPVASRGIDIRSNHHLTIRNVEVTGLTSDGIRIINQNAVPGTVSDYDSSSYLLLDHVTLGNNGGYGFNTHVVNGPGATSQVAMRGCNIMKNTLGGVRYLGFALRISDSSISYNYGDGGVTFRYNDPAGDASTASARHQLEVSNVEFDTNATRHIWVEAGGAIRITENRFLAQTAVGIPAPPATAVQIGGAAGGSVTSALLEGNVVRNTPAAFVQTVFDIRSNATNTLILDTVYASFSTSGGAVKYADAGTQTEIRDEGTWLKSSVGFVSTSTSGSYTPNLLTATYHRIVVNAAGAFTINAPTGNTTASWGSRELILDIYNASGGVITVTFNATYTHAGFTVPADGKRRTARFQYDAQGQVWMLIGSWSPDI